MRAVILNERREIVVSEVPSPKVASGEILVRPYCVGVCGTDLHAPELEVFRPPVVIGHEFSGEVIAVGTEVDDWQAGDRVAVHPNANRCNACGCCLRGLGQLCRQAIWEESVGVRRDGGMAESVTLSSPYLHRLPAEVSMRDGALVEPLACAVRAVGRSGIGPGGHAAIIGAGPIGMLVLKVLQSMGVSAIAVVQRSSFRREFAARSGAAVVVSPEEVGDVFGLDSQEGPQHVFECSGGAGAMQLAIDIVQPGGRVIAMGAGSLAAEIDQYGFLSREATIVSSFTFSDAEFQRAIELLASGAVSVDELVTHRYRFDQIDLALRALHRSSETMKVVLEP